MLDLQKEVDSCKVENEGDVTSYYRLREQLSGLQKDFHSWIVKPQYIVPFLQSGRLISVKHGDKDFGFGAVVSFKKKSPKEMQNPTEADTLFVVDVLLHISKDTAKSKATNELQPAEDDDKTIEEMTVVPISLNLIQEISTVKIFMPKDLRQWANRTAVLKSIRVSSRSIDPSLGFFIYILFLTVLLIFQEVKSRFKEKGGIPLLDPVVHMGIKEKPFKEIMKKLSTFETRLKSHQLHEDPNLEGQMVAYGKKAALMAQAEEAKKELKGAKSLLQMADLKRMKRVLRRLGYCTTADVIEVKGRIACELSRYDTPSQIGFFSANRLFFVCVFSADELLLTEMIFNGLFNNITGSQAAAILSCFVCDERSSDMPKLTESLSGPLRQMQEMARRIAQVNSH